MSKPKPTSTPVAHIGITRRYSSRRNDVTSQVHPHQLHKRVLDIFKRYDYEPVDLEALIFLTLKEMEISINNYEQLHRAVRAYIVASFNVVAGKLLTLQETSMRRVTVLCNRTTD